MYAPAKFMALAFLVGAALISAAPLPSWENGAIGTHNSRSLQARHNQQECEAACTLLGLHGPAFTQCVQECLAGNYPTPPPSPHANAGTKKTTGGKAGKKPRDLGRDNSVIEARDSHRLEARHNQQECEAACTLLGLHGPAFTQCVQECLAGNYPTPPPSPHAKAGVKKTTGGKAGKKPRDLGRDNDVIEARDGHRLEARHNQQECEAACTLLGLHGPAFTQCVQECLAGNYPTPPPSPHAKAGVKKTTGGKAGKKPRDLGWDNNVIEARDGHRLEARHNQQECEAACTLLGLHGPAFTQCVQECLAGNYPTPPPSPHAKAGVKKTTGGKAGKKPRDLGWDNNVIEARDGHRLEARHTQRECEAACTLLGLHGPAFTQCVQNCVAGNYPSPPPSPHAHAKASTKKAGKARSLEYSWGI